MSKANRERKAQRRPERQQERAERKVAAAFGSTQARLHREMFGGQPFDNARRGPLTDEERTLAMELEARMFAAARGHL